MVPYEAPMNPTAIRLADNENPYDFPDDVREKIDRMVNKEMFNRYPDTNAEVLRDKLALYIGVKKENVMVGNGSDELILALMLAFGVGAAFAVATPTFSMYSIHGQVVGAREIKVPRLPDYSLDVPVMLKQTADPAVKMLILCNPNSPTGNETPEEVIQKILEQSNAVVVVDEAYAEFRGASAADLIARYPNLVILRTFSKALSLAGLRVGYLLASGRVMEELKKVKPPYNLNTFSQIAAITVLEHQPIFQTRVKAILIQREKLQNSMNAISGVQTFPTVANFILFRTAKPSRQVYEELVARGIWIRMLEDPALANCLRVTVGTEKENTLFLTALREIMEG
jgi:histidinol-phosphate aminotransferase